MRNFFKKKPFLKNSGYCPICEKKVMFIANQEWLRDFYLCSSCSSIPRERALMDTMIKIYPAWRNAIIHESSPCGRGVSVRIQKECRNYIPSHFHTDKHLGTLVDGIRCENLENLTFDDNSIDIHITQDVLEHVFSPVNAFSEIERTLKPGGMHIFTVPLVNKWNPTQQRSKIDENGEVKHIKEPIFHGNPIGDGRSLVTFDWGYDICECIFISSGLFTQIFYIENLAKGIKAEFIEVLVSRKPIMGQEAVWEEKTRSK